MDCCNRLSEWLGNGSKPQPNSIELTLQGCKTRYRIVGEELDIQADGTIVSMLHYVDTKALWKLVGQEVCHKHVENPTLQVDIYWKGKTYFIQDPKAPIVCALLALIANYL